MKGLTLTRLRRLPAAMLLLVLLLAGACGRGGHGAASLEAGSGSQLAPPPARSVALASLLETVAQAPVPEGVAPDVYARLRQQLILALKARNTSKIVSAPPLGQQNKVSDLDLLDDGAGGYLLQWTYVNAGDYNYDGLVSISDLTPIGQHFQASADADGWPGARRADGNRDGLVTINDLTPIGQNYQTYCTGYNVYGGNAEAGPWTLLGDAPLTPALPDQPLTLSFGGLDASHSYFVVRPHDDLGNEGQESNVSHYTVTPQKVTLGADTFLSTQTVDPAGGTFDTPLPGGKFIRFEFPPNAVGAPFDFRVGTNDGVFQPSMGNLKDPIIALDTGGVKSFLQPLHITVPYDFSDDGSAFVPFIVNDDGSLDLIDLIGTDSELTEATFETYHLEGHLLWVQQSIDFASLLRKIRSTKFDPARDGLQVVNTGSMWFPGGECFGMTSFSNWYFCAGKPFSEGDLYPRFMYTIPIYGGLSGQRIICTRAHASICKDWNTYWNNWVAPQGNLTDSQRFASIILGIILNGHPVLVDLRMEAGGGGAHSVLAYGIEPSGVDIYDPNAPGTVQQITYNRANSAFDPYGGYTSIRYSGAGALFVDEPYQEILNDAKHKFAANGFATIQITSHAAGQNVSSGLTTITGHIESTVEKVDELTIVLEGASGHVEATVPVPASGDFSQSFTLAPGRTDFYFATWSTRVGGQKVFIPHDLPGATFYLLGL